MSLIPSLDRNRQRVCKRTATGMRTQNGMYTCILRHPLSIDSLARGGWRRADIAMSVPQRAFGTGNPRAPARGSRNSNWLTGAPSDTKYACHRSRRQSQLGPCNFQETEQQIRYAAPPVRLEEEVPVVTCPAATPVWSPTAARRWASARLSPCTQSTSVSYRCSVRQVRVS